MTTGHQPLKPTCQNKVCGKCKILHVKCLEDRWLGGVECGSCEIGDYSWPKSPPMPKVKPPGDD